MMVRSAARKKHTQIDLTASDCVRSVHPRRLGPYKSSSDLILGPLYKPLHYPVGTLSPVKDWLSRPDRAFFAIFALSTPISHSLS